VINPKQGYDQYQQAILTGLHDAKQGYHGDLSLLSRLGEISCKAGNTITCHMELDV
jgi:hypothetical protein